MFRIVNKVFFGIVLFISIVLSIVFSIGLGSIVAVIVHDKDVAVTVTLMSLIILTLVQFVVFSMWGMLIETADKVNKLYSERQGQLTETTSPRLNKLKTMGDEEQTARKVDENFWYCSNCGTKNTGTASFCKDCGKYK